MNVFSLSEAEAAEVNSEILWDKIVSIEYVGNEQVYDIEVQGTHNFIGNGIFAHNTYIPKEEKTENREQRTEEKNQKEDKQVVFSAVEEELGNIETGIEEVIRDQREDLIRIVNKLKQLEQERNETKQEIATLKVQKESGDLEINTRIVELDNQLKEAREIEERENSKNLFIKFLPKNRAKIKETIKNMNGILLEIEKIKIQGKEDEKRAEIKANQLNGKIKEIENEINLDYERYIEEFNNILINIQQEYARVREVLTNNEALYAEFNEQLIAQKLLPGLKKLKTDGKITQQQIEEYLNLVREQLKATSEALRPGWKGSWKEKEQAEERRERLERLRKKMDSDELNKLERKIGLETGIQDKAYGRIIELIIRHKEHRLLQLLSQQISKQDLPRFLYEQAKILIDKIDTLNQDDIVREKKIFGGQFEGDDYAKLHPESIPLDIAHIDEAVLADYFLNDSVLQRWEVVKHSPLIKEKFGLEIFDELERAVAEKTIKTLLQTEKRTARSTELGLRLFWLVEVTPLLKIELAHFIIMNSWRESLYPFLCFPGDSSDKSRVYEFISSFTDKELEQLKQKNMPGLMRVIETVLKNPKTFNELYKPYTETKNYSIPNPSYAEVQQGLAKLSLVMMQDGDEAKQFFVIGLLERLNNVDLDKERYQAIQDILIGSNNLRLQKEVLELICGREYKNLDFVWVVFRNFPQFSSELQGELRKIVAPRVLRGFLKRDHLKWEDIELLAQVLGYGAADIQRTISFINAVEEYGNFYDLGDLEDYILLANQEGILGLIKDLAQYGYRFSIDHVQILQELIKDKERIIRAILDIREVYPDFEYGIAPDFLNRYYYITDPYEVFMYSMGLTRNLSEHIELLDNPLVLKGAGNLLLRRIPRLTEGLNFGEENLDKDIILWKLKNERRFRIPGYWEEYISLLQTYVSQQSSSFQRDNYVIKETQAESWSYEKTEKENIAELFSKERNGRDFSGHLAMHQTKAWELFEAILTAGYIIPTNIFEMLNAQNQFQQMLKEGKVVGFMGTEFVHFSIDKRISYLNTPYAFVYPLEMLLENQAFILDPLSVADWAVGGFSANPEHESHKIPMRNAIILVPKSEQEKMEKLLSDLEQAQPGWQRPKRIFYYEGSFAEDGLRELQEKYNLKQSLGQVVISKVPKVIRKLQEGSFKGELGTKAISLLSIKDVSDINGIIKYHDVTHLGKLQEVQDFSDRLEELTEQILSDMTIGEIEVKDTGSSKRGTYQERDSNFPDDFDLMVNVSGAVPSDALLQEFARKFAAELQNKEWLKAIYGEAEFTVSPESFVSGRDGRSLIKIKVFRGNEKNIPVLLIDVNFFADSNGADGIRYQQNFWKNLNKILSTLPEQSREEGKQHILSVIRSLKAIFKNNGVYNWAEGGLRGVGTEQLLLQLNGAEDEFGVPKVIPFGSIDDFKKIYSISNALATLEEAMFNGKKYAGLEGFRNNLPLWDPGSLKPTRLTDRVSERALRRLIDITTEENASFGFRKETLDKPSADSFVQAQSASSAEKETGKINKAGESTDNTTGWGGGWFNQQLDEVDKLIKANKIEEARTELMRIRKLMQELQSQLDKAKDQEERLKVIDEFEDEDHGLEPMDDVAGDLGEALKRAEKLAQAIQVSITSSAVENNEKQATKPAVSADELNNEIRKMMDALRQPLSDADPSIRTKAQKFQKLYSTLPDFAGRFAEAYRELATRYGYDPDSIEVWGVGSRFRGSPLVPENQRGDSWRPDTDVDLILITKQSDNHFGLSDKEYKSQIGRILLILIQEFGLEVKIPREYTSDLLAEFPDYSVDKPESIYLDIQTVGAALPDKMKDGWQDIGYDLQFLKEGGGLLLYKTSSVKLSDSQGGALKSVGIDGEDEVSKVDALALHDWERKAEAEGVETREINGLTIKAKFIYADSLSYYKMPKGLFAYHFYDKQGNLVIVIKRDLEDSIADEAIYHEAREANWTFVLTNELMRAQGTTTVLTEVQKEEIRRKAHILAAAEESVAFGVNRLTPYHQQQLACMSTEKLIKLRDEVREEQITLVRQYLSKDTADKYESYANKFRQKIEEKLAAPDYKTIIQEIRGFRDTLAGEFGIILDDFHLYDDTMGDEHNLRLVWSDYPKIKEYLQRLITNLKNAHPVWRLIISGARIEIKKRFAQEKVGGQASLEAKQVFFPLDSEVLYDDKNSAGRILLQARLMAPEGVNISAELWVQLHEIAHLADPIHRKPVMELFSRDGIRQFQASEEYQRILRENKELRDRLARRGILRDKNASLSLYKMFGPNSNLRNLQDILENIDENKYLRAVETKGSLEITLVDIKSQTVTPYSGTSQHELWAESFTAYFLCPNVLEQKDPIMFSLLQHVIRNSSLSGVSFLDTRTPNNPDPVEAGLEKDKAPPGGIDFRRLPAVLPSSGMTPLAASAIGQPITSGELQQIERMVKAGIIPSMDRIKVYLMNSCTKKDFNREMEKVLSCLADILRLEEERLEPTDLSMRDILTLVESEAPVNEFQLALSKITVAAKLPMGIEPR